ncbi:MAG: TfoX/Sxy family protein [Planctomycetia bacterium]
MAYSESLAGGIRDVLSGRPGVEEKKMFGSLAFLRDGRLFVGVWKDALIVKLPPDEAAAALADPHVTPFDPVGRPMKAWLLVASAEVEDEARLRTWIDRAWAYVETQPAKPPPKKKEPKKKEPKKKPPKKGPRPI